MNLQVGSAGAKALGKAAFKAIPSVRHAGPRVLVPIAIGLVGAIGFGSKGTVDAAQARAIRKEARRRLEEAIAACEAVRMETERAAREYGELQSRVHRDTVGRFADWLERNEHLVKRLNFKKVDGVRIRVPKIPKYVSSVQDVSTGAVGLASGVGAGAAAQAGALWGVSTFASASTGTAITSLSGAAAQNATLAWLGGGAIQAGGGGMAAGSAVLGLVTVVPMLLVGGLTVGIVGARTRTRSRDFAAKVAIEIERLAMAQDLLRATSRRIGELRDLLGRMVERAVPALVALEAQQFDPDRHASEFLRALQLVTEVKEVLNTAVLDPKSGELNESAIEILRKYA